MPNFAKSKRDDIQILRGFAVLSVILFHIRPLQFPNGFLGVDVFFVISGFVLAPKLSSLIEPNQSLRSSYIGLKHFWMSRILRLTPSLLLMLLIITPFIFLLGPIEDHRKFSYQAIFSILFLGNLGALLFSGDYFSPNPNPLLHLWSLSTEEQIYFIFPLILIFAISSTRRRKNRINTLLGIFVALSFICYWLVPNILTKVFTGEDFQALTNFNYYSPSSRIWQFTLGYLVWTVNRRKYFDIQSRFFSNWFPVSIFIFILILPYNLGISYASCAACLLTCFMITLKSLDMIAGPLRRLLVAIGDRSFAIYLFHLPFIFLAKHSPIFGSESESKKLPLLIALFFTFFFSEINLRLIENPRFLSNADKSNRVRTLRKIKYQTFCIFLLVVSMALGSQNSYWGLDKSIKVPPVAWEIDDGCKRMSVSSISLLPCFYGHPNRRVVLLIGDSHAAQISQSLIDAGAEENWSVAIWTQATCQFNLNTNTNFDEVCLKQNTQILSWVNLYKPDLILVSEYVRDESNTNDLFNSIKEISEKSKRTIFIKNIPIFPDENRFMKKETILEQLIGLAYKPPKSYPLIDMDNKKRQASDKLSHALIDYGISSIDFSNYFCKDGECKRFKDGKWLYWDNHHLSMYGAKLVLPELRKVLYNS